jgi:2-hydroxy-3-keto-5-methylthiopentenyl-1-phosphate phosphatase
MRLLNPGNAPALFAGDGLSDRYAVESASLVFAKNGLATYWSQKRSSMFHSAT